MIDVTEGAYVDCRQCGLSPTTKQRQKAHERWTAEVVSDTHPRESWNQRKRQNDRVHETGVGR